MNVEYRTRNVECRSKRMYEDGKTEDRRQITDESVKW
jgi:hypothetical protein